MAAPKTEKIPESFDELPVENQEKIKQLIAISENISAKAVIETAVSTLKWLSSTGQIDRDVEEQLSAELKKKLGSGESGSIKCELANPSARRQMFLHIGLKSVSADYKTELAVPSDEFARQVYLIYDRIREMAKTFWRYFLMESNELGKSLQELLGDLYTVEESPTTMTFHMNSPHRVGISAGYFDRFGKIITF